MKTRQVPVCPWCGDYEASGDFCGQCVASSANPNNDISKDNPPCPSRYTNSSQDCPQGGREVNLDLACRRAGIQQAQLDPEDVEESVRNLAKWMDQVILARVYKEVQNDQC